MMVVGTWTKRFEEVLGRRIAYVEAGKGAPIVFLHGNPTSPYLWRDVVPHVAGCGRCIAPDLIGMGDSEEFHERGAGPYAFEEHRRYVDALLKRLGVRENVILVGHDWGSALAFDWAMRNPRAVAGIVYMEGIVGPMALEEWSARKVFERARSPQGKGVVLGATAVVDSPRPRSIDRPRREEETAEFRRPFLSPGETHRPTPACSWQMTSCGGPQNVAQIARAYTGWMSKSPLPKLFIHSEPEAVLTGGMREFCRAWPNQDEVTVRGIHFVQEDSADEIGLAITEWITDGVPQQLTADCSAGASLDDSSSSTEHLENLGVTSCATLQRKGAAGIE
jgi:haloalkane dehalogenase